MGPDFQGLLRSLLFSLSWGSWPGQSPRSSSLRMGDHGVCHPSSLVFPPAWSPAQPLPSTLHHLLSSSLLHFPSISPFHHASPHPLFLTSFLSPPPFLSPALLSSFPHTLSLSFLLPSPLLPIPSPSHESFLFSQSGKQPHSWSQTSLPVLNQMGGPGWQPRPPPSCRRGGGAGAAQAGCPE